MDVEGVSREERAALEEDEWMVSRKARLTKFAIALFMLILALWAIFLLLGDELVLFNKCVEVPLEPGPGEVGRDICYFKSATAAVSIFLLIPFFPEAVWIALEANDEKFGQLTYSDINDFPSLGYTGVLLTAIFILPRVPLVPYSVWREKGWWAGLVSIFDVLISLPDIILTITLFPLSLYVIASSQTVAETLVNLAAVQVFAQLDDILVKMIMYPERGMNIALAAYERRTDLKALRGNTVAFNATEDV